MVVGNAKYLRDDTESACVGAAEPICFNDDPG